MFSTCLHMKKNLPSFQNTFLKMHALEPLSGLTFQLLEISNAYLQFTPTSFYSTTESSLHILRFFVPILFAHFDFILNLTNFVFIVLAQYKNLTTLKYISKDACP